MEILHARPTRISSVFCLPRSNSPFPRANLNLHRLHGLASIIPRQSGKKPYQLRPGAHAPTAMAGRIKKNFGCSEIATRVLPGHVSGVVGRKSSSVFCLPHLQQPLSPGEPQIAPASRARFLHSSAVGEEAVPAAPRGACPIRHGVLRREIRVNDTVRGLTNACAPGVTKPLASLTSNRSSSLRGRPKPQLATKIPRSTVDGPRTTAPARD